MGDIKASLFYEIPCQLGEGSMWDARRQKLFWVDIEKMELHCIAPGSMVHRSWKLETRIGTIVPDTNGNLVMGMHGYVARFNPDTGVSETLITLEGGPDIRSNDGKCDPAGRLWLGTMHLKETAHSGNLYCIFADLKIIKKISGTSISNGIVWTRDKKKMYWIDTPERAIREYAYEEATGEIRFVRKAVEVPADLGYPDGMTIDENDQLWVAHWGGSGVYHWDPVTGELIDIVEVPAPNVSSCVFGGPDMRTLYMTTARNSMEAADMEKYPLSGSVFTAQTSVRGFAPYAFQG
jgi:sugar lactone lactonase YvrE